MTLKEARIASGLRQHELAKYVQVTQAAVSRWESGEYPPLKKYHKPLARALKVAVEEIDEFKE